jgi:hypothetical protein
VRVSAIGPVELTAAFGLFQDAYADAERSRFDRDFHDKQLVILLHDRETRALRGFSTVHVSRFADPRGGSATMVFSGDTVIHRDYWGQKQLQIAFARILLGLKLRDPRRPVYWFLISKGYRTYLLLANAFARAVPRCDRPDDADLRATLDTLACERFGAQYDRVRGVVRYTHAHERVRDGVATITQRHLENRHVRFFVARNPGHVDGEELACLAEVRFRDLLRIGMRICLALLARAVRSRRGGAGDRRWVGDVRQPEGA